MKITKYICHRRPERSFFYKNHQFPVCARCTGFYLGLIAYLIMDKLYDINSLALSVIFIMPTLIDGLTQEFSPRESNNILRVTTGFIGGIGLIMFLKIFFKYALNF